MRPSFPKIEFTCVSTVFGLTTSFSQMPLFESPCAISSSTSRSRGVSSSSGPSSRLRPSSCEIDLGIDRGSAPPHAPHRVEEVVDLEHAVLQQVAEPLRRLAHEGERVRRFDHLRQEEHGDLGPLGAHLDRGARALVGLRRRHADVDDRDVRA